MASVMVGALACVAWLLAVMWWKERQRANRLDALLAATLRGRAAVEGALADALVREAGLGDELQATAKTLAAAQAVLRGKAYEMVVSLPVVKRPGGGTWSQN